MFTIYLSILIMQLWCYLMSIIYFINHNLKFNDSIIRIPNTNLFSFFLVVYKYIIVTRIIILCVQQRVHYFRSIIAIIYWLIINYDIKEAGDNVKNVYNEIT